jgi:poly-gamma-glutamate capsule biosynthesis protein CapA/YwtB (metallophosphatase superfamily)
MSPLIYICWVLSVPAADKPDTAYPDMGDSTVSFLAVGDVNLGRRVGQVMLSGDTLFAFQAVRDSFVKYDVVFANLESQISDQNGETVSPASNVVFTGPPSGAEALHMAGITLVSTANNHALDYGVGAQKETGARLNNAGIVFAGTSSSPESLYEPAVFERKGLRFALFAVTEIMNRGNAAWRTHVAAADSGKLFPRIRAIRNEADVVILSYHGGVEYSDEPATGVRHFAHAALNAGADLFLGHHPHVPQLVEQVGEKYIVYSLGNFVFQQPSRWWTQYSFALAGRFVRNGSTTSLRFVGCLPVRCGYQPSFLTSGPEFSRVLQRTQLRPSRFVGEISSW